MRRLWIAATALLGLVACRAEDKSDEVLGAERARSGIADHAPPEPLVGPPAEQATPAPAAADDANRRATPTTPEPASTRPKTSSPPPWMRDRAVPRPEPDAPRADDRPRPADPSPSPPRPEDTKPDKAPDTRSPLPETTPPEKMPPQQAPTFQPPEKVPPPSVPPDFPVPGQMPEPVPLKPRGSL